MPLDSPCLSTFLADGPDPAFLTLERYEFAWDEKKRQLIDMGMGVMTTEALPTDAFVCEVSFQKINVHVFQSLDSITHSHDSIGTKFDGDETLRKNQIEILLLFIYFLILYS